MAETVEETRRFPDDISYGSTSIPMYSTDVISVKSGVETRNSNWTRSRHKYNVAFGIRDQETLYRLISWFHAMKGKAKVFRFKDWSDYKSTDPINATASTDQILTLDSDRTILANTVQTNGDGVVNYYFAKRYGQSYINNDVITYDIINGFDTIRPIHKLVGATGSSSVSIAFDDTTVSLTETTNSAPEANQYYINYDEGYVRFGQSPYDQGATKVTAGFEFDVPVRFDSDELNINLEFYEHGTTDVILVEVRV